MGQIIRVVRVLKPEIRLVNGERTLVPKMTIEREQKPENYDVNYDSLDQRYLVAREW